MSYVNIWQKLYDVVSANTGIAEAFNYDPKTYESFPSASISASSTSETILDTQTNWWLYSFIVRVVDQNTSIATMENRMRALCDSLMSDLRGMQLDSTIQRITMNVRWWWIDSDQPLRVLEIEVNCLTLKNI